MSLRYRLGLLLAAALFLVPSTQAQTFFTADLTAAQEPGDVESNGAGTAALALTDEGLRFFVTVDSLTGEIANAHFHHAEAGVNGDVVRGIMDDFAGNSAAGIWTSGDGEPLTDELIQELFAGNLYLNIHTAAYGGGEIRGQIRPSSGTALHASLTPGQSVGEVESDGSGTAAIQVTDAGVLFFVTVDGLTGDFTNAHFHHAPIGENGDVVRGIMDDFDGNTAFGLWTPEDAEALSTELRTALLEGELYLNVHTAAYGGGEIRGQVLPSSGWGFYADLGAEQSTGDVESDGTGAGTFTLTESGLLFQVTIDGLTGPITNAHFHRAAAGEDGPVVRGILDDFDGNTAYGIWTPEDAEPLSDELIRDLLAGNLYVNVHTEAYEGGEIRGQVLLRDGAEMAARLTAAQEPGDVTSDGAGTANLTLTDEGLAFRVTVSGLTGPIANAHFHHMDIGTNGDVVRGIMDDFEGNTATGMWTADDAEPLTEELVQALLEGELYLNIHTDEYGGGEIRGQVLISEGAGLRAVLTNEQAGVEPAQEGSGTAALTLTDAGLVYDLTVTGLTGAITNAHFHEGEFGVGGGVVHGIMTDFEGNTADGIWTAGGVEPLTDELLTALLNGELYLNVHTDEHGGGEIRGQVLLSSGIGSAVQLDPEQQDADVESMGSGTASLALTQAGLAYRLTATGLTGPIANAHFHQAPFGEDGDIVRGIFDEFEDGTAFGIWRRSDEEALTNELARELLAGNIYINLHTAAYPAGEIRGQVRPGNVVSTAIEPASDELPNAFRLEQNYPNPFNPATMLEFALNQSEHATLEVFDVVGRRVATLVDGVLPAGEYAIRFDAEHLPSGAYFYRLSAGDHRLTRSMILMR